MERKSYIGDHGIGYHHQSMWADWDSETWPFLIKQCLENNVGGY